MSDDCKLLETNLALYLVAIVEIIIQVQVGQERRPRSTVWQDAVRNNLVAEAPHFIPSVHPPAELGQR